MGDSKAEEPKKAGWATAGSHNGMRRSEKAEVLEGQRGPGDERPQDFRAHICIQTHTHYACSGRPPQEGERAHQGCCASTAVSRLLN
jgi:hypothetical protein